MRTYTDFLLEAACAYKYVFCALRGFCVRVRLVLSKRLVSINTSFARKADFVYVYGLCVMRTNTSFARIVAFLHCLGDSFGVAMTVVLDVLRFVRHSDDRRY